VTSIWGTLQGRPLPQSRLHPTEMLGSCLFPWAKFFSGRKWDSAQGWRLGPGNLRSPSGKPRVPACSPPGALETPLPTAAFTRADRGRDTSSFPQSLSAGRTFVMAVTQGVPFCLSLLSCPGDFSHPPNPSWLDAGMPQRLATVPGDLSHQDPHQGCSTHPPIMFPVIPNVV
jgi:hypothetical protein